MKPPSGSSFALGAPLLVSLCLTLGAPAQTPQYAFTNFAGLPGGPGYSNGTGIAARFNQPSGVAADTSGNLYVADTLNHVVRKIAWNGTNWVATTLAGAAGLPGGVDGTGAGARFFGPQALAVNRAGSIYVADTQNNAIRQVTSSGLVTTLAGHAGTTGAADGAGSAASFNKPAGLALDPAGNLYIADTGNNAIRKVTAQGVVTTIAGAAIKSARVEGPQGVAVDAAANIYIADTQNGLIRKVTSSGVVSTLAGLQGSPGYTDGVGGAARFYFPSALALDGSGDIYVADTGNNLVRRVTPSGTNWVVATIAGDPGGDPGSVDGTGKAALFSSPGGVTLDGAGNLYVADTANCTIRKLTESGTNWAAMTLAGAAVSVGAADGAGGAAQFNNPTGVAVDPAGNVYVGDTGNGTIRKASSAGVVTTLAGRLGAGGDSDGQGLDAGFYYPSGLAVDSRGNVYVADIFGYAIRMVTPAAAVTTFAGTPGARGSSDGIRRAANFNQPKGVAMDHAGNLYVADSWNSVIRKITPQAVVTTLAGSAGNSGYADGTNTTARFYHPSAVAVDGSGNVYVADTDNSTIRKMAQSGTNWTVTTLAGLASYVGSLDGAGRVARFSSPSGLAVDGAGNLYVADTTNCTIRMVTPAGTVTTIAGSAGQTGGANGLGTNASFSFPTALAFDAQGNLYVADSGNNRIVKGTAIIPPWLSLAWNGGTAQLALRGQTGGLYTVQYSSNLAGGGGWQSLPGLTNGPLTNNPQLFLDSGTTGSPLRFYRAVASP